MLTGKQQEIVKISNKEQSWAYHPQFDVLTISKKKKDIFFSSRLKKIYIYLKRVLCIIFDYLNSWSRGVTLGNSFLSLLCAVCVCEVDKHMTLVHIIYNVLQPFFFFFWFLFISIGREKRESPAMKCWAPGGHNSTWYMIDSFDFILFRKNQDNKHPLENIYIYGAIESGRGFNSQHRHQFFVFIF